MDILIREELKGLLERCNDRCVSIYMPTERATKEVEQNSIRLKNLLEGAEQRLIDQGLRAPEAREYLEPVRALVPSDLFWQYQGDGLAIFLSPGFLRLYRLPLDFEPAVVVADSFHVKPLVPMLMANGPFYVLAVSQNEIRLFQGTRYTIGQVSLQDVPKSLVDVLRWDDVEQRFQFHTTTRTPVGERVAQVGGARPAIFHGHGVGSADDPKDYLSRYFHQVDQGVSGILGGVDSPLVLAGVDYLHPIYREANTYPHLLEEGIEGNPDHLTAEELHERALAIVEPLFRAEQEEAAAQYRQLAGTGSERVSNEIEEVVPAAHFERVAVLFVTLGTRQWGRFDPESGEVRLREEPQAGDEDLLNRAAVDTLLNDGTVYALEPEEMPDESPVAAVFRY